MALVSVQLDDPADLRTRQVVDAVYLRHMLHRLLLVGVALCHVPIVSAQFIGVNTTYQSPWINDDTITIVGSAASEYIGQDLAAILNVHEDVFASCSRIELDVPSGTASSFCWINQCYDQTLAGEYPTYTSYPFEFIDDWYNWWIDQVHIYHYPNGVADTALYQYQIFRTDSPDVSTSFVARFIALPFFNSVDDLLDGEILLINPVEDGQLRYTIGDLRTNEYWIRILSMTGSICTSKHSTAKGDATMDLTGLVSGPYVFVLECDGFRPIRRAIIVQ